MDFFWLNLEFLEKMILFKFCSYMSSNIYDRTGLMETPRSKPSPPPPRVSKLNAAKSDGTSSSPAVPNTRLSLDRSSPTQTVNSKPSRTSRVPTPDVCIFSSFRSKRVSFYMFVCERKRVVFC